mgnify:CR=1 FL=1
MGKSESYVYRRLKLLDLVKDARRALEADRMTVAHAERLARLTPDLQQNAYDHELYHPFYMFGDGEDDNPKDQRLPNRGALRSRKVRIRSESKRLWPACARPA